MISWTTDYHTLW